MGGEGPNLPVAEEAPGAEGPGIDDVMMDVNDGKAAIVGPRSIEPNGGH